MKLPIGIQDFEKIRQEGWLYIDKTEYIHRIVSAGDYYFLSRPRRFGKSLLLSTLRALYEGKKELFQGLWIADHWNWEDERNVIHLKFSSQGLSTLGVERAIYAMLAEEAKRLGIVLEREGYDIQFRELIEKASNKGKVVVLIDEYDKPIVDYLDQAPKAAEHRQILKNFYSGLKDSDPYIELVFITGVSRFVASAIALDSYVNLTSHRLSHQLLGVTEEELIRYFHQTLTELSFSLKMDKESLRNRLQLWYYGYSWDGVTKVYNPFSLMSFFLKKKFACYWQAQKKHHIGIQKTKQNTANFPRMKASDTSLYNCDWDNLNPIAVLFQKGYLTIEESYREGIYLVNCPNQEVRVTFNWFYESNGSNNIFEKIQNWQ